MVVSEPSFPAERGCDSGVTATGRTISCSWCDESTGVMGWERDEPDQSLLAGASTFGGGDDVGVTGQSSASVSIVVL